MELPDQSMKRESPRTSEPHSAVTTTFRMTSGLLSAHGSRVRTGVGLDGRAWSVLDDDFEGLLRSVSSLPAAQSRDSTLCGARKAVQASRSSRRDSP